MWKGVEGTVEGWRAVWGLRALWKEEEVTVEKGRE